MCESPIPLTLFLGYGSGLATNMGPRRINFIRYSAIYGTVFKLQGFDY